MKIEAYRIQKQEYNSISSSIIAHMERALPDYILVGIVPVMLAFYATSPERYEVTQVDILVSKK